MLAVAAQEQQAGTQRQRAMGRASRAALGWQPAASDLVEGGVPLTELPQVGPWLAGIIEGWVREQRDAPEPPPLRAGFVAWADARRVCAAAPAWHGAVRCDLQMHTLRSDGHASLETMARRCLDLGYDHLAVTDHSEGLRIAHGMDAATLAAQAAEVSELNTLFAAEGQRLRVLHGIEMNVDPDGRGDTDPQVLAGLDLVLGAFHSKLRLIDDQTERYIRALRNPTIDVLAHPRGRKYNQRLGLMARWDEVFAAAAELGVAVEVDSYPDRQDLDVELLGRAAGAGAWIAVDTDAHHPEDLDAMSIGVAALVAAGVPRERVLNTMGRDELQEWVASRRARSASVAAADRVILS